MFREWLGAMLCANGRFTICGEADNIVDALAVIRNTTPHIAIVDLTLRGSSGLELIKDLKAHRLDVPVLVLSMHSEELYAERVLQAGARGYICKHEASSTLTDAIRCVVEGGTYLSEKMKAKLMQKLTLPDSTKPSGIDLLADRELEVFYLLGKGYTNCKIADQLSLGEATVETYRVRIKAKLGFKSAVDLYSFASRWVAERGL